MALDALLSAYLPPERIRIKWPNDLLVGGAKIAGILLEGVEGGVIVGLGVNLASSPTGLDRAVTALATEGVEPPDPGLFAEHLADSMALWVQRWRGQGLEPVRRRWLERAHPPSTPLTVRLPDGGIEEGLFDGLDAAGALRLRRGDGSILTVHAGDVFLL